jgi:hypothetical protein
MKNLLVGENEIINYNTVIQSKFPNFHTKYT